MNPLISIIIPVYNVEQYLHKCINSVLEQTYENIEVYLVDDGSTDSSGRICDSYQERDSRVIVIHKANGGQGSARNIALNQCHGEYIMFVDSDDSVEPDIVAFLYDLMISNQMDISISNYSLYEETGRLIRKNVEGQGTILFTGIEAVKSMWYREIVNIGPWAKLYKRFLWNEVRFEECFAEDLATMHKVFLQTDKIVYSYESKLNYLVRRNSDIRSFNTKKLEMLEVVKANLKFAENYKELKAAARNKAVSVCFHILFQMPSGYDESGVLTADLKSYIRKYRWSVLKDQRCRRKVKYALLGTYLGFGLVKKALHYMKRQDPSF